MGYAGSNYEQGIAPESGTLAGPGSYVGVNADGEFILTSSASGGGGSGDITAVAAGNGLTGGGTTGAVTLTVGAGTGIDVATNAISVDVSDFLANGANNRIVTAVNADSMNGEANLTFDGNKLTAVGQISSSLGVTGSTVEAQSMTLAGGDGALEFSVAGQNSIKIPDNQATALIVEEANNAYLTFVTTNDGEKVVFDVDGKLKDNKELIFGNDDDAAIEFKSGTNQLIISGTHPLGTAISASVDFADSATFQDDVIFNDSVKLVDDKNLIFGTNNDAIIQYAEASTNRLIISGSTTGISLGGGSIALDFGAGADKTINSGTLAGPGSYIGLDANNLLVLTASSGGGATIDNDADNRVTTAKGDGTLNGEANLTFDDTNLAASRAIFGTTVATLTVAAGELSTLSAIDSGSNKYTTQYDGVGDLQGQVLSFGGSTVVKNQLYFLSSSGGFHAAQANDDDSASPFLAIALNTNSTTHGMLTKGIIRITGSLVDDTMTIGAAVYVSKETAGRYAFVAPTGSGEIVRQVGYCLDINTHGGSSQQMDMLLYFNPSDTFIELA